MIASKFSTLAALALAAISPVLSAIVVTKPVASTSGSGGKGLTVEWNYDSTAPAAADYGSLNIYLATGSHDVQYKLQTLDTNVATSATHGRYTIDADAGPDGGFYFIRIEGTKVNSAGVPPMAFSARFTLDDMDGSFNSTIRAQIDGAGGTASAGGAASATRPSTSALRTSTLSSARTSATATATAPSVVRANTTVASNANAKANSTNSTSGAAAFEMAGSATLLTGLVAAGLALF